MSELAPMRGIVHVVDDDSSYRTALGRVLRAAGLEAVLYAGADEYLGADDRRSPACVLLDLRMPGSDGLDLQAVLRARGDAHPVVFLSGHGDIPSTVRAIKEGAIDFLTKPVATETLLKSVALALERDHANRSQRLQDDTLAARYRSLTRRERQVMAGVVAGRLNKQIAYALATAERTVKTHRARVMAKMGVRCVPDLVHLADRLRACGTALEPVPGDGPKDALPAFASGAQ